MSSSAHSAGKPHLERGFGLLRAVTLNLSNMVGTGPFLTVPLMLAAMGGPQVLVGWALGAVVAACDGMVWAELGAAWPGSGGSYRFLLEAFGRRSFGRLMAFLFIWQFVLSGPLEIASGMIGAAQYASYLLPAMTSWQLRGLAVTLGVLSLVGLYRRIESIGKLSVALGASAVLALLIVIFCGLPHFDRHLAFNFPPNAFSITRGFFLGLGNAMLVAMFDYLGYYDVCYIGDEVKNPARTIPRAILFSVFIIACLYLTMQLVIVGVVPWQEAMQSKYIASELIARLYGRGPAIAFTFLILWIAFGSIFALLLGYSRIPYAAARDGNFFAVFARIHPEKHIPHISLLAVGGVAIATSLLDLDVVIKALITGRILVQFVAQICALPLLRRRLPAEQRPFRMWLYPVPALVALLGWLYIFATSGTIYIVLGLATLVAGIVVYMVWARAQRMWPFPAAHV